MMKIISPLFWLLRGILAAVVFAVLVCLWLAQIVLFIPLLIYAQVGCRDQCVADLPRPVRSGAPADALVFDRLMDVSKLQGCNTRNTQFRWQIFQAAIVKVKESMALGETPRALDFGAGCLRDTYELAQMGFKVSASDLNETGMEVGFKFYDWSSVTYPPQCVHGRIETALAKEKFHVITSFDVVEHLHEPTAVLGFLLEHLTEAGVILITVPNRRTLGERVGRFRHCLRTMRGHQDLSGVPHVQFRTPSEWSDFFQSQSFRVLDHDMAIGALVNDAWAATYGLPCRIFIEPVVRKLAKTLDFSYQKFRFERIFYPAWLMQPMRRLDDKLKPYLKWQWAWNLFVLGPT